MCVYVLCECIIHGLYVLQQTTKRPTIVLMGILTHREWNEHIGNTVCPQNASQMMCLCACYCANRYSISCMCLCDMRPPSGCHCICINAHKHGSVSVLKHTTDIIWVTIVSLPFACIELTIVQQLRSDWVRDSEWVSESATFQRKHRFVCWLC